MSTEVRASFEDTLKMIVREAVREELQALDLDDRLLTAEQAAEMLGYPDSASVRRLAREGKLETVNLGENTRRYRRSDVQRLVQQGIR
jgi:excisionase family DNA binding protein